MAEQSRALVRVGDFEGTVQQLVANYEGNLSRVMPSHVNGEAFVGLAVAYVSNDAKLMDACVVNPQSLIIALRECAALGHTPMKKIFALVPYNDKNATGGKRVVGIETYHGVVERMFRAGGVTKVTARVVREADHFAYDERTMSLPDHKYDHFAHDREHAGPLKGVYAYALLRTGAPSHVVTMGPGDIAKHRAASRSGEAFWGPPWPGEGPWTEDMWMKTALHGLERWVPTSAEYRWQVAQSEAASVQVEAPHTMPLDPPRGQPQPATEDVHDAEIVDEEWPETAKPGEGATK